MAASNVVPEVDARLAGDERWALVNRIAASQHLRSSPRLREFLFYVARCAIREAPEDATEQQIGIRVFGRHPGYNSSEDSIVRTHARLLRQKLAAYFAEEGSAEPIVMEVPKGHYLPVFHTRAEVSLQAPDLAALPQAVSASGHPAQTGPIPAAVPHWIIWLSSCAVLTLIVVVTLLFWRPWRVAAPAESAVDVFWRPFLNTDPPLVIYSNALFQGSANQGLRYAVPDAVKPDSGSYVDTYTGIGELASVYTLTRLFDAHHGTFILKRSLLVTWDEAQLRNLIFIGARVENPSLRVLQPTSDFTMVASADSAGVVNVHPLAGEPAVYSRPERPLTTDYAIIALQPGIQSGRRMLVFSGLTTFGTQAAVDYVCHPETAAMLLKKITGPKGEIRFFEAVLQTDIGGGVPLQTRLVTVRVH